MIKLLMYPCFSRSNFYQFYAKQRTKLDESTIISLCRQDVQSRIDAQL